MKYWSKLSKKTQEDRVTEALSANINYKEQICLGIPASSLDPVVFSEDASFLKDAPLLRCYVKNPNHIGCHTLGESEVFFRGTQEIEKDVINILATDMFHAAEHSCDGYIASGGTEANIQAVWIYRNYFIKEFGAKHHEVCLLCSEDTHYSIAKASNLTNIPLYKVAVDDTTRQINPEAVKAKVSEARSSGVKYFIVIANMGTTMFGSVDEPGVYTNHLLAEKIPFKLHVDGAFGGFIFPMSNPENKCDFRDPYVSSITLDAHKMLQAPYGTGIFLCRKGLMEYVYTEEAQYVNGMDITLSGSRSGTNAVAIWMILTTYGPYGWLEKINKLLYRTTYCCNELDRLNIGYYRHPMMNIITIRARHLSKEVAQRFGLVPDSHNQEPEWYKIVVMDHVEIEHLEEFIASLKQNIIQQQA